MHWVIQPRLPHYPPPPLPSPTNHHPTFLENITANDTNPTLPCMTETPMPNANTFHYLPPPTSLLLPTEQQRTSASHVLHPYLTAPMPPPPTSSTCTLEWTLVSTSSCLHPPLPAKRHMRGASGTTPTPIQQLANVKRRLTELLKIIVHLTMWCCHFQTHW